MPIYRHIFFLYRKETLLKCISLKVKFDHTPVGWHLGVSVIERVYGQISLLLFYRHFNLISILSKLKTSRNFVISSQPMKTSNIKFNVNGIKCFPQKLLKIFEFFIAVTHISI